MIKSFSIVLSLVTLWSGLTQAQTALTKEQPPSGPLIVAHMPDSAAWVIDFTYAVPSTAESVAAKLANYKQLAMQDPALAKAMSNPQFIFSLSVPRPKRTVITKTDGIRHDESELERSYKSESWLFNNFLVVRQPNTTELTVSIVASAAKDFPEFDWISANNYIGIKQAAGINCLTFQEMIDPMQVDPSDIFASKRKNNGPSTDDLPGAVQATAYIESQTRRPAALVINKDSRRYIFGSPPATPLVVPEDFAAAAKEMKARIDAATKPLSPP